MLARHNRFRIFRWIGLAAWVGIFAALASASLLSAGNEGEQSPDRVSLIRYLAGPPQTVAAEDQTGRVHEDDPVFARTQAGRWTQVGYVRRVRVQRGKPVAEIAWFSSSHDPNASQFELHHNRGRIEDVVALMLPAEKRARIRLLLAAAIEQHGAELAAALQPLVERSLRESIPIIEQELRLSLQRHRPELEQLTHRLDRELVDERIVPLVQAQILPIVREHAQPAAESIGRELWDRASIWRFGWRAVYDKSPLPKRELVKSEWDRFVEEEAVPVLEAHSEELVEAVQQTISDVVANAVIRQEIAELAGVVAADPEARRLTRTLLREVLVDNERLKQRWREIWSSQRAGTAISLAGDRLEPVMRGIGDELFGTRAAGIDPQFARVLRSQILGKDRRWIVAKLSSADESSAGGDLDRTPAIQMARERLPFPVVHLAAEVDGEQL